MAKPKTPGFTNEEVGAVLSSVASELQALLKTTPGQETPAEEDSDVSATAPAAPSDGASEGAAPPAADGAEASSAPPTDAPPSGEPDGDEGSAPPPGGDPVAGDASGAADPEAIKAEFLKLPPEHIKMYLIAASEALKEILGGQGDPSMGGGEASAPPPPPAAPPAPVSAPPAMKSEFKDNKEANGGFTKSEQDLAIESLSKKVADQDSTISKLVTALETFVSRPERKAVTGASFLGKSEETKTVTLTKAEVTQKLNKVASSALTKSEDRELINDYYANRIGVEKLGHLLK
jgi:hypothetical protein